MTDKRNYSSEELQEFKELILEKLEKASKDFEELRTSINQSSDNTDSDTAHSFKTLEEGASVLSKEEIGQLAERQNKFIQHLQAALIRIENKTYGICRVTGKLISKERLRIVPHATLTIDAKQNRSANSR